MSNLLRNLGVICVLFLTALWTATPSFGVTQSFGGPAAGSVIAGDRPGGGTAPGTLFPGCIIGVLNNGGGPHTAIIFDSSAPTGGDEDLGTPNEDFGGPGIGIGGEAGQPGENSVPLRNLLIIAENIVDSAPADGFVDDPDDEAGGGVIGFGFDELILPTHMILVDIDVETASLDLRNADTLLVQVSAADLGNNSVQTIDLSSYGPVDCIEVVFSSSGAIAELAYDYPSTSTKAKSWGELKQLFQ